VAFLRTIVLAVLGRYGARLRFPGLLGLAALCFVIDVVLPDGLPFLDEIGFALATLLFAAWRRPEDDEIPPAV